MNTDELLNQIQKLLEAEREYTKNIIREETVSKEALKAEIQASEERIKTELKGAIEKAQEETIAALSELIHTGFNLHEERIKALEDQAEQPHKN